MIRLSSEDMKNIRGMEEAKEAKITKAREAYYEKQREEYKILVDAKKNYDMEMSKARAEFFEIEKKAMDDFNKELSEYQKAVVERERLKAEKKKAAGTKSGTGNSYLDNTEALLKLFFGDEIAAEIIGDYKAEEEKGEADKVNETEAKKADVKEHSTEEKLAFIKENLGKIDKEVAYAFGLADARVIKSRSTHKCNTCDREINVGDTVVATYVYADKNHVTAFKFWEDEYSLVIKENGLVACGDLYNDTFELKPFKVWIDIDCAYKLLVTALKLS